MKGSGNKDMSRDWAMLHTAIHDIDTPTIFDQRPFAY